MTSKPMVERKKSDHGNGNLNGTGTTIPFLSPESAQGPATTTATTHQPSSTSTTNSNRLLPSPIPPPTASSITSQQRPQSRISAVSGNSRDSQSEGAVTRKSHSQSVSSNPHTLASSSRTLSPESRDRERQRAARTLPPWVLSADDDENVDATSLLLPRTPTSVRHPCHNFMPTPKSNVPGRKFDHAREGAPVTLTTPVSDSALKWKQFAQASSSYGDQIDRPISSRGQIVDDDWMKENMPDLETPWEPIDENKDDDRLKGFWLFSPAKRKRRLTRFHKTIMNHPMVPAVIRMIVLMFSIMALSLAGAIFHNSDSVGCENNSSTWMAIVVDAVAVVYTVYITYDEYTSKPLGLRSHNAKMSLIFLDLAFIVFESANLSLAFQALTDGEWACGDSQDVGRDLYDANRDPYDVSRQVCPYIQSICTRQKALVATLLIALLAWLGTFTISTLRLIHRVAR
ncbi:hypothetical protein GQ44DRAFT_706885 [Phaeosphaeriaceae sp. PMI808]|nr:hypothetical protein GQ44DRAFT_706885 [Phaeosphaeriaceae sp. PMI808]